MTDTISIEARINDLDPRKVRHEQKQELFECIRHFLKYKAFQNISGDFAPPEEANTICDALIALFESQYESSPDDKPE